MTIIDILHDVMSARIRRDNIKMDNAHSTLVCATDRVQLLANEISNAVAVQYDSTANPTEVMELAQQHIAFVHKYNIPTLVGGTDVVAKNARAFYKSYNDSITCALEPVLDKMGDEIFELRRVMRIADKKHNNDLVMECVRKISEKRVAFDKLANVYCAADEMNKDRLRNVSALVEKSGRLDKAYHKCAPTLKRAEMELKLACMVHDMNKRKK